MKTEFVNKTRDEQQTWVDQRIQEILGQMKRRERFKAGERVTLEQLVEKHGAYPKMCHNCAFLPGSPERKAFVEEYPSQLSAILESIESAVLEESPYEPFFCHREMPTSDGGKTFQPEFDDEGLPVEHKICAGWMRQVSETKKLLTDLKLITADRQLKETEDNEP